MDTKRDLRIRKTKKNIRDSFLALLQEKPFSQITVLDICTKAMCSRNTFYVYYTDKEELFHTLIDECVQPIQDAFRVQSESIHTISSERVSDCSRQIIEIMDKNASTIRAFLNSQSSEFFKSRLEEAISTQIFKESLRLSPQNTMSDTYQAINSYQISGMVGFICFWLQNPAMPKEKAIQLLEKINSPSIWTFLNYLDNSDIQ
ncbi:MAG: TetR/AcrR family transcriptional regulator [Lachnospiraceae bacterium]